MTTNGYNVPKLSFCITCKNRLHQIKHTLRKNLEDNRIMQELVEFILVDFGSTDGLHQWISENFNREIQTGYLKYFYTEEMPYWHASIAKNTAHLLGQNEILVNLDCDNYTGENGGWFVIWQFINNDCSMVLHQCSDDGFDGSFGRISIKREDFLSIGGYDESFEPAGYQDLDIINRFLVKGYQYVKVNTPQYNKAIRNSKEEGISFTRSRFNTWNEMDRFNAKLSLDNISAGNLVANNNHLGIQRNIFDIEGRPISKIEATLKHKLSFNITCMNRLHHLRQTLEQNIQDNLLPEEVEFNLLDYNSTDGLEDWIKQQADNLFSTGVFNYYKTLTPICYHRTHSRNMIFRLSTGDIVCNLDADNFLGKGFAIHVLQLFHQYNQNTFYTPEYSSRDVIGRICVQRKHFSAVNGYNESLSGYGLEDIDFYDRLFKSGIDQKFISDTLFYKAIQHTHKERISQEYLGKHIAELYLSYINPYQTQILLKYQDGNYFQTTLTDNVHCNHNQKDLYTNINQYFLSEKNRILGSKIHSEGRWKEVNDQLTSYHKVDNTDLQSEILVYLSETHNFWEIKKHELSKRPINPDGFGQGTVYKNFNYNTPILLK